MELVAKITGEAIPLNLKLSALEKILASPVLASIITFLGLVFAGLIGQHIKTYLGRRKEAAKIRYVDRLKAISQLCNSMEEIQAIKQVYRVFLVEVSNGGAKPRPGSVMYAKAVELRTEDRKVGEWLKEKYKQVPLDGPYIDMCIQAQSSNAPYVFDVEEHAPCILRDFYLAEKIRYSEIHHIYTDVEVEKMFIMSVATRGLPEDFQDERLKAYVQTEVMQIRASFNEYRN